MRTEFPQLFTTVTTGASSSEWKGVAVAVLRELLQPSTVCVSEYFPPAVTVIDEELAPLLHNKLPVYIEAVRTELPQLSATSISGGAGIAFGTTAAVPGLLVQELRVCVTEYSPADETVIEADSAPLLHKIEPVVPNAVNVELPHSFTTLMEGAGTITGVASAVAEGLLQPLIVCVTE